MLAAAQDIQESFQADEERQKDKVLEAELVQARTHLRQLKQDNRRLSERLSDCEFRLDELLSERKAIEETITQNKSTEQNQSDFFAFLSSIEEWEKEITTELASGSHKSRELTHYHNKLVQANKELRRQLELKRHRLALIQDTNRVLFDALTPLQAQVDDRAEIHRDLIRAAFALQTELNEITVPAKSYEEKVAELRAEHLRRKELLETRKREQADALRTIATNERVADVRRRKCEAEVQTAQSIRTWETQRKSIKASLRKARVKLGACLTNLEGAMRRDAKLSQRIIGLVHGEDPGDATGLLARQILRAEIDAIPAPEDGREMEIELEYKAQLKEQLDVISQAKKDLEEHRAKTLAELERELEQSSSPGYLLLLQEDLNALKAKLAGTRRR
jgi:hypothetical protein